MEIRTFLVRCSNQDDIWHKGDTNLLEMTLPGISRIHVKSLEKIKDS
jgi:hypothetical protein